MHKPTALERIGDTLALPTNIVAGAAERALGLGRPGLVENIKENIEQKGTWGDILRQKGAGPVTSAVLGFAGDVVFDPLGGLTEGAVRLVPNIIKGVTKGGAKGLALAVASHAAMTAEDIARNVHPNYRNVAKGQSSNSPILNRVATWARTSREDFYKAIGKTGGMQQLIGEGVHTNKLITDRIPAAIGRLAGERRVNAWDAWLKYADDTRIGRSITKALDTRAGLEAKFTTPERGLTPAERALAYGSRKDVLELEASGTKVAEEMVQKLKDAPDQAALAARNRDKISRYRTVTDQSTRDAKDILSGYVPDSTPDPVVRAGLLASEAAKDAEEIALRASVAKEADEFVGKPAREAQAELIRITAASDADALDRALTRFGTSDASDEAKAAVMRMSTDDQKKYLSQYFASELGGESALEPRLREAVAIVDRARSKVLMNKSSLGALRGYGALTSIWKTLRIGVDLALYTTSMVGNFMATHLFGIHPFDTRYVGTFRKAAKALSVGNIESMRELMGDTFLGIQEQIPDVIRDVTGINPFLLQHGSSFIDSQLDQLARSFRNKGGPNAEKAIAEIQVLKALHKTILAEQASSSFSRKLAKRATTTSSDPGLMGEGATAFRSQEFRDQLATKWIAALKEKADKGSAVASAAHFLMETPIEWFSKIDQIHKVTNILHLVNNGISETELLRVARWMGKELSPSDVTRAPNGNLFFLSPVAALKIANRIHMDYKAMPAAVKVLKRLPVLGSPFFSYQYGMTYNLARAMGITPAHLNKINMLLKEVSGDKSPEEEAALNTKYYEHLQEAGWMKMPWFTNSTRYANLAQYFPQYQANLLRSDDRSYRDNLDNKIVQAIDASPFFETVEGRFMLNYILLPLLTHEALTTTGQQIYPEGADFMKKLGLGAAQFVGNLPPSDLLTAPAIIPFNPPEGAMPYLPFGYRSLKNALQGKSASGAITGSPSSEMTAEQLIEEAGLPTKRLPVKKPKK